MFEYFAQESKKPPAQCAKWLQEIFQQNIDLILKSQKSLFSQYQSLPQSQ